MKQDLFRKTFDQQLLLTGGDIANRDISPNRRIVGEIVFEPMGSGVRVTARDESHRLLWGFVGSEGMLKQIHCPVAVYDTLQDLISQELRKVGSPAPERGDPVTAAESAIKKLEGTVRWLKKSMRVKKVSEATKDRARSIARLASDADRQMNLDAASLKGMKSRTAFMEQDMELG